MEDLVWKRLVVLAAALAASIPLAMVASAAPASAAVPACGATTATAHWSTQQQFSYAPAGWCMKDAYSKVVFQSDGNLVWYRNDGHVFWSSNTCTSCTGGKRAVKLSFQIDGNIVIYRSDGIALWAIGQATDRTNNTQFYWQVKRTGEICALSNYHFELTHFQTNPDHTLHTITRCPP
jgi:REP element-mobilizing transposase RayT